MVLGTAVSHRSGRKLKGGSAEKLNQQRGGKGKIKKKGTGLIRGRKTCSRKKTCGDVTFP